MAIERLTFPQSDNHASTDSTQPHDTGASHSQSVASSLTSTDGKEPVDMTALLARVENDWDLLQEMIELFLESSPPLLAEIEAAVARRDRHTVERAAHALKGAMLSISAVPAAQAASNLSDDARLGTTEYPDKLLSVLKLEFDRLVLVLTQTHMEAQS